MPVSLSHLELVGVGHRFGRHRPPVLAGIDLSIARGEAVALVGRSGCGKSTLLHIIAGLLRASDGLVRISGEPVTGPSARWNMMFQSPSLLPWMSAADNVGLGLRYAGIRRADIRGRVRDLLALVHLDAHADDNVQQLSGGQQQRVALARSLATRPEVLLLDEPFSALDPFTRATLQTEVRSLARELGLTLVIVTHDVDEALLMADRAVVMAPGPGRIVGEVAVAAAGDRQSPEFQRLRQEVLTWFDAQPVAAPQGTPRRPLLPRFIFGANA